MKTSILLLSLLCFPQLANSQAASAPATVNFKTACLPAPAASNTMYGGSKHWTAVNTSCVCVGWTCNPTPAGTAASMPARKHTFCGTWPEFAKSSARIATIQKAKDPQKSLDTLGNRITVVPMTPEQYALCPTTP